MNMALSKAKTRYMPAPDLQPTRMELSRARFVARAWSETIPGARRTGQAALFARGEMKPVVYTRRDVERTAARRYRPGLE